MRIIGGAIIASVAAVVAIAAHGAALLEADGLVTEKSAGWRFEASGAKGGAAFNPLEGWFPDKGGKLVSPRIDIPKAGAYYKLSFTGSAPVRSYETVAFYDAAGNMIADNYDVIYGVGVKSSSSRKDAQLHSPTPTQNSNLQRYERVVFAQEGVKEAEVFFQSPKGCTVSDVKFELATVEDAAKWCDGVYAKLPPLDFAPVQAKLPPKTLDALKTGKPWRILMLGDSIMQDTFHSQFHALVKRAYPKSDVTWLVSVRGSTGCWYYCEPENFRKYVADYKPDCVFIGGNSGWIHPEMPLNGGPAIASVARRVNEELGAEVVIMTPTLAIDLRVPKGTERGTAVAPSKFDHAALGDRAYDAAAAEELKAICAKNGWPLWDMFTPAYDWLFKTGFPSEFYSRDYVHSGELGKQIIGRIALDYFTAADKAGGDDMTADAIVNGVHGYMPDSYVVPKEPEVREKLEWLKDQKLALMMHFGMYSQMGVYESWPLSDADAHWSRVQIDWTDDAEAFKRQYWDLWKSFNPVRFQPGKWARLAKDGGFRRIDIRGVQRKLVVKGILPEKALAWNDGVMEPTDDELKELVASVADGYIGCERLYGALGRARPLLAEAYRKAVNPRARQNYAVLLGLVGDVTGAETLAALMDGRQEVWTRRNYSYGRSMDVIGVAIAAGRVKNPKTDAAIRRKIESLHANSSMTAYRVATLAAEASGFSSLRRPLAELLKKPSVGGWARVSPAELPPQGGYGVGPEMDRCIKELAVARALMACGDCDGLARKTFEAYAHDPRGVFAEHANAVLKKG